MEPDRLIGAFAKRPNPACLSTNGLALSPEHFRTIDTKPVSIALNGDELT